MRSWSDSAYKKVLHYCACTSIMSLYCIATARRVCWFPSTGVVSQGTAYATRNQATCSEGRVCEPAARLGYAGLVVGAELGVQRHRTVRAQESRLAVVVVQDLRLQWRVVQ